MNLLQQVRDSVNFPYIGGTKSEVSRRETLACWSNAHVNLVRVIIFMLYHLLSRTVSCR